MGAGGGFREDVSSTMNEKSRPRKNYGEQTLIPCTIRMIKSVNSYQTPGGGSGGFVLPDGRELHQIKLVAAVVEVDYNSTNTNWKVEDGTGSINVKMFNNEEIPAVMEMHQQVRESRAKEIWLVYPTLSLFQDFLFLVPSLLPSPEYIRSV
jgi:replication factor A2